MKLFLLPVFMGVFILMTSTLSVSAAVPTSPPPTSGAPAGGYFSKYFTNLRSSPTPISPTTLCTSSQSIIVGFDTTNAATLFTPKCREFSDILQTTLSSYSSNLGI